MTKSPDRNFSLKLAAAAIFALAARLVVSYQLAVADGGLNPVFKPSAATDLNTYMMLARSILSGDFSGAFYYQPFYYAVFLPLLYAVGGGSNWAVIIAQSLLGAFTCYLAGLIAARLYGRTAGIFAAILSAISATLIFYTPYCMLVTLQAFNLTMAAYLTVAALQERRRLRYFFWLGLVLGVGILTRGNMLLAAAVILLLIFWQGLRRREYFSGLLRAGIAAAMMLAVQLPFIVYNSVQLGRLSGPSTASSAVLALGNTPEAPPGFLEYPDSYESFMEKERRGEISVPMQIFEWAWREPAAYAELTFRKLLLFWDRFEIYNNVSIYHDGVKSPVLRFFMAAGSAALLISLGVAGMLLFFRRALVKKSSAWISLYCFVLVYWVSIAMFYNLSRFRAPVMPLLAVFGGIFASRAVTQVRRLNCRKIFLASLPALAIGIFLTFYANDLYREYYEAAVMRLVRPGGVTAAMAGGSTMKLDSGPRSCGQWQMAQLKPNSLVGKVFYDMPPSTVKARVRICLLSPKNGLVMLLANGEEKRIPVSPGMAGYEFDVDISDGMLVLNFLRAEEGTGLVFDGAREYYRSAFNAETLPGEWVMRVFY